MASMAAKPSRRPIRAPGTISSATSGGLTTAPMLQAAFRMLRAAAGRWGLFSDTNKLMAGIVKPKATP